MGQPAPAFAPLGSDPEPIAAVAALLARALPGASAEGARAFLDGLLADQRTTVAAAFDGDRPLAVYVLRKVGVASELLLVAADPGTDPARGLEAAAVRDAGDRVGRRPLTVQTSERAFDWYKGLGFKLVGRRRLADGSWSYRMGWHGRPEGAAANVGAAPCPDPAALVPTRPATESA